MQYLQGQQIYKETNIQRNIQRNKPHRWRPEAGGG